MLAFSSPGPAVCSTTQTTSPRASLLLFEWLSGNAHPSHSTSKSSEGPGLSSSLWRSEHRRLHSPITGRAHCTEASSAHQGGGGGSTFHELSPVGWSFFFFFLINTLLICNIYPIISEEQRMKYKNVLPLHTQTPFQISAPQYYPS